MTVGDKTHALIDDLLKDYKKPADIMGETAY